MGEKTAHFIQRLKLSKNMQFSADADIFMDEKYSDCNLNQWV